MRLEIKIHLDNKRTFIFFTVMLLLFGLFFWAPSNAFCKNNGFKYLENYTPNEYNGQDQNWSILQDKRGIIYVGNQGGLLEFDGVSWRLIQIPNDVVRSMAIDGDGTIYIGGENEIGFLETDSKGALQYVSLLNHINDNYKNFSTVWRTHATNEGIYFRTSKFLFRWNPVSRQMKAWEPKYQFTASFVCGGRLYIQQEKDGLMYIKNDSLNILPGGGKVVHAQIYMLVSYDTDKLLIGTRSKGFYLYDGKTAKPFATEVDNYIKEKELYYGIRLSSSPGNFVLATLQGGLVIIDSYGRLKEIFTKSYGLQDNDVRYVFEDSLGNLWLGLNSGISKIEYTSPFSVYDDRANLPGRVLSVIRHHRFLYAGTNSGLYSFATSDKFTTVHGIPGMCWRLLSIGDSLLVATTTYGVSQIGNKIESNINGIRRIIEEPSYVLLQSKAVHNRIWVGTAYGLVSLYLKNESGKRQWEMEYKFEDITEEIRTVVEDKRGNLWLGTPTKGVLNINFSKTGTIDNPVVTKYYTSHGLPPGKVNIYTAAEHVIFATGKGIFRFDEKNKVFIPDLTLGAEFAGGTDSRPVLRIVEDKNKNIWFTSESRIYQAVPGPKDSVKLHSKSFLRIPTAQVNAIYPDPDGKNVWIGTHDGLIRYDSTLKKNYQHDFQTLIRKVLVNDKMIFDGYKNKTSEVSKDISTIIEYKDRSLHIEFAAPFFEAETETQYQCFLEGYGDDWSAWNKETKRNYKNLDSGLYTFHVRAKNVYEHTSSEGVYRFKVLPPWHKTWWAFLLYGIGFYLLMFLGIKWRSSRLEREKQKLEHIIKERTREINDKNEQLQKKTLQLEDQSEKLKEMDTVKSRFFANISHEFRTPLTLIMSPLEEMLSDSQDKKKKNKINMMLRYSRQLLTYINQLLDLSRFDSGKTKLQAACQNIVPFLKGAMASFHMLAQQNKLELSFQSKEEDISIYFDTIKIEEAMNNLLINAIKFTPPGGKITVSVSVGQQNQGRQGSHPKEVGSPSKQGFVEISVRDTGMGMPKEQLDHIFDRFYQAKSYKEKGHKGTGIGLALTKEIVLLHHGKIDVHSQEGKGTEFVIRLPMGHDHLKQDEILASPETAPHRREPKRIGELDTFTEEESALEVVEGEEGGEIEKYAENGDTTEAEEKNVILVVEDHRDMRKHIRSPLEPLYTVVEASDGKEGITKAKEIIPDLIVSDIMMPEKDGYELCRELKNDIKTSHIPIILLTAKASEESIMQGLETGADDYITKPFNSKMLLTRIKNLTELRRQLQLKIQRRKMLLPAEISVSSMDENFLKEFQDIIEKNLSDEDFNVDVLCEKLYMGRSSLFRKVQALTGETPNQFILSYRLERAAQLLKENFGNVTEVAFEVGFSSTAYFSKCFKEKFYKSPSSFKASESQSS